VQTATAAEFFLSDGVIVTGSSTGKEADSNEVKSVKEAVKIPVIIGSGITIDNIEKYYRYADAFIIGSHFKKDGSWKNEVDSKRVKTFMEKLNELRK
jgi:predicted TIM-barrel enzyme